MHTFTKGVCQAGWEWMTGDDFVRYFYFFRSRYTPVYITAVFSEYYSGVIKYVRVLPVFQHLEQRTRITAKPGMTQYSSW